MRAVLSVAAHLLPSVLVIYAVLAVVMALVFRSRHSFPGLIVGFLLTWGMVIGVALYVGLGTSIETYVAEFLVSLVVLSVIRGR